MEIYVTQLNHNKMSFSPNYSYTLNMTITMKLTIRLCYFLPQQVQVLARNRKQTLMQILTQDAEPTFGRTDSTTVSDHEFQEDAAF